MMIQYVVYKFGREVIQWWSRRCSFVARSHVFFLFFFQRCVRPFFCWLITPQISLYTNQFLASFQSFFFDYADVCNLCNGFHSVDGFLSFLFFSVLPWMKFENASITITFRLNYGMECVATVFQFTLFTFQWVFGPRRG